MAQKINSLRISELKMSRSINYRLTADECKKTCAMLFYFDIIVIFIISKSNVIFDS